MKSFLDNENNAETGVRSTNVEAKKQILASVPDQLKTRMLTRYENRAGDLNLFLRGETLQSQGLKEHNT
jgi:hypothetical protein